MKIFLGIYQHLKRCAKAVTKKRFFVCWMNPPLRKVEIECQSPTAIESFRRVWYCWSGCVYSECVSADNDCWGMRCLHYCLFSWCNLFFFLAFNRYPLCVSNMFMSGITPQLLQMKSWHRGWVSYHWMWIRCWWSWRRVWYSFFFTILLFQIFISTFFSSRPDWSSYGS